LVIGEVQHHGENLEVSISLSSEKELGKDSLKTL
jgi:hypothetical protein